MKNLLLVSMSLILFSGCANKPEDIYSMQKPQLNQYDAYIAQANALKDLGASEQQVEFSKSIQELEYKYKIALEKEKTKRIAIKSPSKQRPKKRQYVLPEVCNEESAKNEDNGKDEVCAALKEVHDSLENEFGEPEDNTGGGGIVINAQGASDFAINVQSHGNSNEGRKSQPVAETQKPIIPIYARKNLMPAIPQPPKGFWESFSDNLFGSIDNVVDKVAENADVIGLGYVGGQLAKRPTIKVGGDVMGGDNNENRNDWTYKYSAMAAEEGEIE